MEKEYEKVNKYKTLDRTRNRLGHGREREVGDGRREIKGRVIWDCHYMPK